MLVVCTDCHGKWLIISKFNLHILSRPFLLFLWLRFVNQYCLPRRQDMKGFAGEKPPAGKKGTYKVKIGTSGEKPSALEEFVSGRRELLPQLLTSQVVWGCSPHLSLLTYRGYNLCGANSTSFAQCQVQSVPARCWCPSALPWYKH